VGRRSSLQLVQSSVSRIMTPAASPSRPSVWELKPDTAIRPAPSHTASLPDDAEFAAARGTSAAATASRTGVDMEW